MQLEMGWTYGVMGETQITASRAKDIPPTTSKFRSLKKKLRGRLTFVLYILCTYYKTRIVLASLAISFLHFVKILNFYDIF